MLKNYFLDINLLRRVSKIRIVPGSTYSLLNLLGQLTSTIPRNKQDNSQTDHQQTDTPDNPVPPRDFIICQPEGEEDDQQYDTDNK